MRWRSWACPAAVMLAAVMAAGCADDETGPPATSAAPPTQTAGAAPSATPTSTPTETPTATPEPGPGTPTPDTSIIVACNDILAPLDKQHRLPADCAPADLVTLPAHQVSAAGQQLRQEAAAAFGELFAAAQADGYTILAASAYRSFGLQVVVYADHVRRLGVAGADRVSARPGHSEHQLGTTTDVTSESAGFTLGGFEGTAEAAWLAENAWRFGFVVSYPEGKEHITGYSYEPWHIRWIGEAEASAVRESGLTLHEWLLR